MLDEIRTFGSSDVFAGRGSFRVGVTSSLQPVPDFKTDADFLFAQVSYSLDSLLRWREQLRFRGRVYAGVMVVASTSMAKRLTADHPQLEVPEGIVDRIERDASYGVAFACDLIERIRTSGAFDGVHLVPVSRYREVAHRLEESGWVKRR
jgi:5,10-methylenetetrahydrofolate reductase